VIEELARIIGGRKESLTNGLTHGNAKSFEDYAKFVGQITTLEDVENTIQDLMKKANGGD
tara:strand:+ start:3473 stop:3652 length:180 start_codon:yes stop_codon:yes gene_type:complete